MSMSNPLAPNSGPLSSLDVISHLLENYREAQSDPAAEHPVGKRRQADRARRHPRLPPNPHVHALGEAMVRLQGATRGKPCHHYGIALAALAGLLPSEIAELRACDVILANGRWWIELHPQRPSTPVPFARQRRLVVVQDLVDEGFLHWVEYARSAHPYGLLFPGWADANRPGDALRTWVYARTAKLRSPIGLIDLRHGFKEALMRGGCSGAVLARIMGRSLHGASHAAAVSDADVACAMDATIFVGFPPPAGRPGSK